jgi:hypothetical protein
VDVVEQAADEELGALASHDARRMARQRVTSQDFIKFWGKFFCFCFA